MKDLIRVLHCTPAWFSPESVVGGGERWVDNVMLALASGAPNIQQSALSIGHKEGLQQRNSGLFRIVSADTGEPGSVNAVSASLWEEFHEFDLIHVHQALTEFGAYACCVAASLGKTIIITDHGGGLHPIMLAGGLRMAHGIFAQSNYAYKFIAADVSLPNLSMIGPIDTSFWQPPMKNKNKSPSIICVSRIIPFKGIDRIIRALPSNLHLKIVGRVYDKEYRRVLGQLARGKMVEFIHDADDKKLLSLYQDSTLFAQGSCIKNINGDISAKTELMGITTLEALSCGLPIVVPSDGGSLPELVTDKRFGVIFDNEADLKNIFDQHQAGTWPGFNVSELAHKHIKDWASLESYGKKLGDFYTFIHRSRISRGWIAA